MPSVVIIGSGKIGSTLQDEIKKRGWRLKCIVEKDYILFGNKKIPVKNQESYKEFVSKADVVFLAIPTFDNGLSAFHYIKYFAKKKIPVITCEKGSLGNFYEDLKEFEKYIGYSAAVGGGTRFLSYLRGRDSGNILEIKAVLNGTLNFIFDSIRNGVSANMATKKAIKLGYSEPGNYSLVDVINAEMKDVLLKSVILFNLSGLPGRIFKAKDIVLKKITAKDLERILKNKDMRFIVSISGKKSSAKYIGGFVFTSGEWIVRGGFREIKESWIPRGVNNAMLIRERGGEYLVQGPGAGALPTVSSMIKDAVILMNTK